MWFPKKNMFPLKLVCGFLIGIHLCSLVSYQPPDFYGNLVTPNPFSGLARIMYFHECPARPCMTPKNCPPDTIPKTCISFVEFPSPSIASTQKVPPPIWGRVLVIWHIKLLTHAPTRSFQEFEIHRACWLQCKTPSPSTKRERWYSRYCWRVERVQPPNL